MANRDPDKLSKLTAEFKRWRRSKVRRGEPIPAQLLERATKVAAEYGVGRVSKTLTVDRRLLKSKAAINPAAIVSVSRMDLPIAAKQGADAIVEIESPAGAKIRLFALTAESVSFAAALWERAL